jgi:hypothetical protein
MKSHLERKVVRLAHSASVPDGETIFAKYQPHFLTLVPRLVVRIKRGKRAPARNLSHSMKAMATSDSQSRDYEEIQHSCIPNSQVEGSVAASPDCEFHSSLRCNLVASRDIFHINKLHHALMYLEVNRCANEMPAPKTPDSIMSGAPLMK